VKKQPNKKSKKTVKARLPKISKSILSQEDVEEVVAEVAGRDVVSLIKHLRTRKNVSEFSLASIMKREINIVRNMLYRLHESNLVTFTRKKDKKKGWYIYYWTFNELRVRQLLLQLKKQRLEKLKERIEREKKTQFYVCYNMEKKPDGHIAKGAVSMRLDFDQAVNYGFRCPETGQLLEIEDNTSRIKQLEEQAAKLAKDIAALQG
jgi:transcription initiation factor TFIIE subunit alpha